MGQAKDADTLAFEKDFSDALLSVWLGANPIQEDLKKELLKG